MKPTSSSSEKHSSQQYDSSWFSSHVITWFLRGFYTCCAILVGLEFIIHRHSYTNIEKIPLFYVLFGIAISLVILLISRLFGVIVARHHDYYDDNNNNNIKNKSSQDQSREDS